MTNKTILITGAAGNIGRKLRWHLAKRNYELCLLDRKPKKSEIMEANFSAYDQDWVKHFAGADVVVHLAADSDSWGHQSSIYINNFRTTENVLRAAAEHHVGHVVFASSNWVMAGYRNSNEILTADLPSKPINPYGASKQFGEELGRRYAEQRAFSFIALRIGWCQPGRNRPGAHMGSRWDQLKWLDNRDMCQGFELAAMQTNVPYAILNVVSNNPGMRWDIEKTKEVIGYKPEEGAVAVWTPHVAWKEFLESRRYARASVLHPVV